MNIFKRFYISLFMPKQYKEFLKSSGIAAFFYLVLISLLLGLLSFSRSYSDLNKFFNARKEAFEKNIPVFEIKDGSLDLKGANVIVFQEESWTFILNDKESSDNLLNNYSSGIALGKDSINLKYDNSNLGTTNYSSINLSLTDVELKEYINSLDSTLGNTYLTFMVISFMIFSFILSFILAIIGKIISIAKNINLKFKNSFKLSLYGITPCLALLSLFYLFEIGFIWAIPLCFLVSIIYIYFGIIYLPQYTFGNNQ